MCLTDIHIISRHQGNFVKNLFFHAKDLISHVIAFSIPLFYIDHNAPCLLPPKFELHNCCVPVLLEQLQTMVMQNFGG